MVTTKKEAPGTIRMGPVLLNTGLFVFGSTNPSKRGVSLEVTHCHRADDSENRAPCFGWADPGQHCYKQALSMGP